MFVLVLKMILGLILIIFMINILLQYIKLKTKGTYSSMNILDKTPVGNNSSILIVEILGNYYLMSLTSEKMEILKELDEKEVEVLVENKALKDEEIALKFGKFKSFLKRGRDIE